MQKQILADHVGVTLEINPRVIVPDTNCFVDHLEEIKKLTSSGAFAVRVPLTVLGELDGLARGADVDKYGSKEHAFRVTESAERASEYLRSKDRPSNLKCVTTKGNLVANLNMNLTEEDDGGKESNDDLILRTCVNLCKEKAGVRREDEKGRKMMLFKREVVLLTDDRNLKLKAHIADIPVNKLRDFTRWAFPAN